jgi:peptide/nickel transport system ATP-binding protein
MRVEEPTPPSPLLEISNLTVAYRESRQWLTALRDISLVVEAGETVGLVGESGSGKTTLVLAMLRYLGRNSRILAGRINLSGQNLLALSRSEMRAIWGRRITLVPQDPSASLNPSIRIGEQIAEALRVQLHLPAERSRQRAVELLEMVEIANPHRVAKQYPHQVSGGMQQRILIALALSTEPDLLVLDEPTSNLDVTTQAVVLDLVRNLIRERHTAALYVTHNLGVVAQLCDRVAVLYAGELVELARTRRLFAAPLHPYTRGLLGSIPHLGKTKAEFELRTIQGQIPSLHQRAQQSEVCNFRDRCLLAIAICQERPQMDETESHHWVRCHRWQEIMAGDVEPYQPEAGSVMPVKLLSDAPSLAVKDVEVRFPLRLGLGDLLLRRATRTVRAVDGVSIDLNHAQTLGLVGESGSGKTTLARALVGLVQPDAGRIELLGDRLPSSVGRRKLDTLRRMQMVFQNPDEALNPYLTVGETLSRPLVRLLGRSSQEARRQVPHLLKAVRLPATYANRFPDELSGGERQRVAIARAIAADPDVFICDEPVSALDVSVQASILNLLNTLQGAAGNSLLFISHDLAVVGYLADQIAVIYLGRLMEITERVSLFQPPMHPYTEALISAIPLPDPIEKWERLRLEGDLPQPELLAHGCPFHTRCPRKVGQICEHNIPPWHVTLSGKRIYCHIPLDDLAAMQTTQKRKRRSEP